MPAQGWARTAAIATASAPHAVSSGEVGDLWWRWVPRQPAVGQGFLHHDPPPSLVCRFEGGSSRCLEDVPRRLHLPKGVQPIHLGHQSALDGLRLPGPARAETYNHAPFLADPDQFGEDRRVAEDTGFKRCRVDLIEAEPAAEQPAARLPLALEGVE